MATPNTNITGFNALFATNTGALVVQMPDGTTANGNARGAFAVDLQSIRTAATQVASGANSFAAGFNNTASGNYSTAMGKGCVASGNGATAIGDTVSATFNAGVALGASGTSCTGNSAIAIGYGCASSGTVSTAIGWNVVASGSGSVAIGSSTTASADNSIATGTNSTTRTTIGSAAHAGSSRAASGDRNIRVIPLCAVTTNATATVLTTNASAESTSNTWVIPNNFGAVFTGWVIARNTANNDQIAWRFEGMVTRDGTAATVALLGAVTPTAVGTADAGMSTCVLAVGVNTTNGSVIVTATGIAATTIHWNGWIDCSENG